MARGVAVVAWLLLLGACAQAPPDSGDICRNDPTCPGANTVPNVGGGGPVEMDSGVPLADAGFDGGVPSVSTVRVNGTLVMVTNLPPGDDGGEGAPAATWTVQAVNAPTPVATTTSDQGLFLLNSVPVSGGVFGLAAVPPPELSGISSFMQFAPGAQVVSLTMFAVPLDTLQEAATGGAVTIDQTLGQLVVQLSGDEVSGVAMQLLDQSGRSIAMRVLYDADGFGFTASLGSTESAGMILGLNVSVPAVQTPVVARLVRGGASVDVQTSVGAGAVTWLQTAAP